MELSFLTVGVAFVAGILSFVSPCCLPLVPAYLSYITGVSVEDFSSEAVAHRRTQIFMSAVAFAVGLALVFTLVFGTTATLLGQVLYDYKDWFEKIAGALVIVFGLHMLGVIHIGFFEQEKRMDFTKRRAPGFLGAMLMGAAFGIGWTPCVGPILGGIITMASQANRMFDGMVLLLVYGLGLGVPFVLAGILIGQLTQVLSRIKRYMRVANYASGALLIFMGLLLMTSQMTAITVYLTRIFGTGLAGIEIKF
ncbi:MAG: sulfite exporter TauE/SafE family protein [Chloroflexi bacterium]|nr:sulfite exporter TauE/SafE family protein [Chloroflexota bacterium]